nr:hypothetical protein [Tanacetum cinerariifolium]
MTSKTNVSISGNCTFSFINSSEALNVDDPVTKEVESGNKASTFGVQEERQRSTPLVENVDYSGDQGSEDQVEPVENEMTSYLASKPSGLDMLLRACWNNEEKHRGMLTTAHTMMICIK